ncbi:LuxR C-terminal-related transcriptional regulator [Legionella sp. km772]|uniref:LuxR C-terminal-related transcriptional regulator n=1 Tax=Legionella sp. km772 TaxID=2498111 RepID=UPI000F8D421C|nr:LuxR C-terminal-related transcriptional regulator [Legionella sp. km772]RUR05835.1 hypothetical protein ELY15_13850 [Legionella sp. km772]
MAIEIPQNHISVSCAKEMREIISPLFDVGISYFEHVRLYNSGKIAWLSTDDLRAESILKNEIAGALSFDFNRLQLERYLFAEDIVATIQSSTMRKIAEKKLIESRDSFDIRNLFQIVSVKNGKYEAFVFGTNEKSTFLKSHYIKSIAFLEQFIFYYYNKAERLINHSEENAIQLKDLQISTETLPELSPSSLATNKYYFDLQNRTEYLTNKEFDILRLINRGYSRKQVADHFNLKVSTIDSSISNAIERNNVYNLRNMLNKINNSTIKFSMGIKFWLNFLYIYPAP